MRERKRADLLFGLLFLLLFGGLEFQVEKGEEKARKNYSNSMVAGGLGVRS